MRFATPTNCVVSEQLNEEPGGFELRLVLIGVSADEVDDLAIAVGCLLVFAACLVNHSQPIVSIVYFEVAYE